MIAPGVIVGSGDEISSPDATMAAPVGAASSEVAMQDPASADLFAGVIAESDDECRHGYPGAKEAAGVYQRIISLMPPHDVYIEACLGGGAIMRRKRRAERNIGLDPDGCTIAAFGEARSNRDVELVKADCCEWLPAFQWRGDELVYLDPPYLGSTRRVRHRRIYRCEMTTEEDHAAMLAVAVELPCMVMISGYPSDLYAQWLGKWECEEYRVMTRRGPAIECLWWNFPRPTVLHDYRYLGDGFHDRQRIRRKISALQMKLMKLPALERAAIIAGCIEAAARGPVTDQAVRMVNVDSSCRQPIGGASAPRAHPPGESSADQGSAGDARHFRPEPHL